MYAGRRFHVRRVRGTGRGWRGPGYALCGDGLVVLPAMPVSWSCGVMVVLCCRPSVLLVLRSQGGCVGGFASWNRGEFARGRAPSKVAGWTSGLPRDTRGGRHVVKDGCAVSTASPDRCIPDYMYASMNQQHVIFMPICYILCQNRVNWRSFHLFGELSSFLQCLSDNWQQRYSNVSYGKKLCHGYCHSTNRAQSLCR